MKQRGNVIWDRINWNLLLPEVNRMQWPELGLKNELCKHKWKESSLMVVLKWSWKGVLI